MIPSGYKEDVVYSQIPTDGSGDLSFTRASNGTRVNSAGLVEDCPWNMLQYSEDFTNAVYQKRANISLTANATTAPNGTNTATRMYANANTTVDYGMFEILPSQSATLSVYAKKGELNYVYLGFNNNAASEGVFFNLNTGAISQNTGSYSASIESVGNGWYRCIAYFPTISYCFISPSVNGTSFVFNNQLNNGLFIWGAQLNIGSTAKPYFPTTDRLNVPRLTYQNGGGGCPSLLLEKQSTNLQTWSEQHDNAAWIKLNLTIIANQATSPSGSQDADLVHPSTGVTNDQNYNSQTKFGLTIGASYTQSVFLKSAGFTWAIVDNMDGGAGVWFNLVTGTIGTITAGCTAKIENYGNGWYRCSVTSAPSGTTGYGDYRLANADNNDTVTASGTSGIYAWGFQLEASSYPTSYIPTTSASATRVADGPVNLSTTQTLTNFTLFWDGLIFQNGENMFFGSGNSAWYIDIDGSNGRIVLDLASGRIYNAFSSLTTNQRCKLAVKRSAGVVDAFVNGTKLTPNTQVTDTTSLTLSSITWGFSSTYYPKMKVNEICAFQSALSDSDCQALTTL